MSAVATPLVYLSERAEFKWCVKSPEQSISSGLGWGDYSFRVNGEGLINLRNGTKTQKGFQEDPTHTN